MKKINFCLLLLVAMFMLIGKAHASHILGQELGYTSVAPGTYILEYKVYIDCQSGITPAQTVQLNMVSPGCGGNLTVTATKIGATFLMQPYCAVIGNNCGNNNLLNIMEVSYSGFFHVPSTCPEWILSVRECSIAPVANLNTQTNPNANCQYLEAYINTTLGNHNVSPAFVDYHLTSGAARLPALFFNVNSLATIPNLAISAPPVDNDSIGYALKPALDNANVPVPYVAGRSFSNPIPSANGVTLNPKTGMLSFTPNVYNATGGYAANTYTVVIEVAGYKKINGVMTKINSRQRSIPVIVVNNAANSNPGIVNVMANGQAVPPNAVIQVQGGNSLTLQFDTYDTNPGDSVSVLYPLPSASNPSFTLTNGLQPTGTLNLNIAATPQDYSFFIPVKLRDNACPVRGYTTQVFEVKVLASPTGIKKELHADLNFRAYPNPFSETLSFSFNKQSQVKEIRVYNVLGKQIDIIPLFGNQHEVRWLNAAKYPAGNYIAKLISEDKTVQSLKFTKLQ